MAPETVSWDIAAPHTIEHDLNQPVGGSAQSLDPEPESGLK